MVLIKRAQISDVSKLVELTTQMLKDTPLSNTDVSASAIAKLVVSSRAAIFIAYEEDKAIGFVGGVLTNYFWSDYSKHVQDLGLYVLPEHRGGSAAVRLLATLEGWAEENVPVIDIGQSVGHKIDETRHFYERMGYTVVGFNARKRLCAVGL